MRQYSRFLWISIVLTGFVLALGVAAQELTRPVVTTPVAQQVTAETAVLPAIAPEPSFTIAASANDVCSLATQLDLSGGGSGGTSNVTSFTEDPNDPTLSCTFGTPGNPRGYRTAWYYFVAPRNGRVTIETLNSSYDTILAVYAGCNPADQNCTACGALTAVTCNDDANGLTSKAVFNVTKDQTYYIEIADFQSGIAGGAANLSVAVWLEDVDSRWTQVVTSPLPPAISRHALVKDGTSLYVIGGQTASGVSNELWRFDTTTNSWTALAQMPGSGYANTTAALVNGKIYVPGGDNGSLTAFDGTHWVYDIAKNSWSAASNLASVGWPDGVPFAWAAAVASGVPSQNGYYLIGGLSSMPPLAGNAVVSNKMYFYFADLDQWVSSVDMPVSERRYAHTAAWVNGKVCVAGGLQDNPSDPNTAVLLSNGLCYTPGGTWVTTGDLNVPRYGAGSAVAEDGSWYIFGGADANGEVSAVERYNPATNSWELLDIAFDLGGSFSKPARYWPRGAFVGHNLWVVGGEFSAAALSLMERLYLPPPALYLPLVLSESASDDYPAVADPLALNVPQQHNFDNIRDLYDVYYFDLSASTAVTIRLTQIPANSDYNLTLYDANKLRYGSSLNPGTLDETIATTLGAGRYYLIVQRVFPAGDPNTGNYQIVVEGG